MTFIKTTEDFICEHCDFEVTGDGYTNHCPKCLWSKHVDVSPGDRASTCGGLMKPIDLLKKKGEERILHKCTLCGYEKNNRLAPEDDYEQLVDIMKKDPRDR